MQCEISLDETNGVRRPAGGSVFYGESANVTCNTGYAAKPSDYQVRFFVRMSNDVTTKFDYLYSR